MLAIRIPAAGQEFPIFPLFDDHGIFAFIARYFGFLVHRQFNRPNVPFFIPFIIPGVVTFRVTAAGDKRAVFTDLNGQLLAALGTVESRRKTDPFHAEHSRLC